MPQVAKQASKGGGMFRVIGRGDARIRDFYQDEAGRTRSNTRRYTAADGWIKSEMALDEMFPGKWERSSSAADDSTDPVALRDQIEKLQRQLARVEGGSNPVPSAEQQVATLPENAAAGNRDTRFPPGEGPNAPEGAGTPDGGSAGGGSEAPKAAAAPKKAGKKAAGKSHPKK